MIGEFDSGFYLFNSYLSDTIKNLRQKGLNENTYSTLNRCFPNQ